MQIISTRLIFAVGFVVTLACNIGPPAPPTLDPVQNEFGAADFGDAPDPTYPTLRASNGARTRDVTQFWLGTESRATTELDAQVIDRDVDDGLVKLLVTAGKVFVTFQVVKSKEASPGVTYFNLLADSDGDGKWQDFTGPGGPVHEWAVVNKEVNLKPGETMQIDAEFALAKGNLETWLRAAITDSPVNAANFQGGWDGTGRFERGEIEDYHIKPGDDWNVECNPNPLELEHGKAGNISLRVLSGRGAPNQFKIVSVVGTAGVPGDPNANEITVGPLGVPALTPGFTTLGVGPHIRVTSKNFDPPARTMEYTIDVRLEAIGRIETEKCIAKVIHTDVKPANTPTRVPTTLVPLQTPRPTFTPTKPKPTVNTNSPVKVGSNLILTGQNFPAGLARKLVLNPSGQTVYDIEIQIPVSGLLSATFYIAGPAGRWTLVIRFAGEEIRIPFDVIQ